jgi:hypothetical protein
MILMTTLYLLSGCSLGAQPPALGEIRAQPDTTIKTGDTASLTIAASGTDLKFEWSALRGKITDPSLPNVIYTAPDTPGPDTVTLRVTNPGGEILRNITFNIVEPPPPTTTVTPPPADTPTPSPLPDAFACNSPFVTRDIFPQLADETGQFPFYGPETESRFTCEGVYDIFHSEPIAVHIVYENFGNNFGWWGIATVNGYDVSLHSEICFWAYAQEPDQSFRMKMKDITGKEEGIVVTITVPNQWRQVCTDISTFAELGIQVNKIENVNLGFEQPTGSVEIWVDDFELK